MLGSEGKSAFFCGKALLLAKPGAPVLVACSPARIFTRLWSQTTPGFKDWQRKGGEGHFQCAPEMGVGLGFRCWLCYWCIMRKIVPKLMGRYGPIGFDLFEHLFSRTQRCRSWGKDTQHGTVL